MSFVGCVLLALMSLSFVRVIRWNGCILFGLWCTLRLYKTSDFWFLAPDFRFLISYLWFEVAYVLILWSFIFPFLFRSPDLRKAFDFYSFQWKILIKDRLLTVLIRTTQKKTWNKVTQPGEYYACGKTKLAINPKASAYSNVLTALL